MTPPPKLVLFLSAASVVLSAVACGDDSLGESASEPGITGAQPPTVGSASASESTSASSTSASDTSTSASGTSSTTSAATTDTATATREPPVDDALLVATTLPAALACGALHTAELTLQNSGTTTWSQAQGYALGAVGDSDPLVSELRADLPQDLEIAPGETYTFGLDLVGPEIESAYLSDWQMLRDDAWFGEIAEASVEVACPEDPPPDLDQVIWLHTDVSGWEETMTLESIDFQGNLICMNHGSQDEGVYVWPEKEYSPGTWVVGNPWIFIEHEEQWYAATWEWLRPDQTCKAITSVAGDHIKVSPFDAQSGWEPTSGETYYFMISGLARQTNVITNVQERSNLLRFVWP